VLYLAIPAQNEDATIGVLLWRIRTVLAEFPREYEVVVYDDGSTDETAAVAEQYAHVMPVTVLRGGKPMGYAGAVNALVRHITGHTRYPRRDAMMMLQGDFTDPPDIVPEFARRFEGGADLVVGERTAVVDAPTPVSRLFKASGWAMRPFVRVEGIRDMTGSMRLIRISALRDLLRTVGEAPVCEGDTWTANADLLLRLVPHARRIETVPLEPTYGVRTRDTRRVTVRDALAALRWAWRARKRRVSPSSAPETAVETPTRTGRGGPSSTKRDEPDVTADTLRERSRERDRLRGESAEDTARRDGRPERSRERSRERVSGTRGEEGRGGTERTTGSSDAAARGAPPLRADTRTDPRADTRTDPRADTRTDPRADTRTDPRADTRTDPRADTRTDPRADPRTDTQPDPRTDTRTEIRTDARPDRVDRAPTGRSGKADRGDRQPRRGRVAPADDADLILDDPFAAPASRRASTAAPRADTPSSFVPMPDAGANDVDTSIGEAAPIVNSAPRNASPSSLSDASSVSDRLLADTPTVDENANEEAPPFAVGGDGAVETGSEASEDIGERKRRRNRRSRRRKSKSRGTGASEADDETGDEANDEVDDRATSGSALDAADHSDDGDDDARDKEADAAMRADRPSRGSRAARPSTPSAPREPLSGENHDTGENRSADDVRASDSAPHESDDDADEQDDDAGPLARSRRRGRRGRRGGARRARGRDRLRDGGGGGEPPSDRGGAGGDASAAPGDASAAPGDAGAAPGDASAAPGDAGAAPGDAA